MTLIFVEVVYHVHEHVWVLMLSFCFWCLTNINETYQVAMSRYLFLSLSCFISACLEPAKVYRDIQHVLVPYCNDEWSSKLCYSAKWFWQELGCHNWSSVLTSEDVLSLLNQDDIASQNLIVTVLYFYFIYVFFFVFVFCFMQGNSSTGMRVKKINVEYNTKSYPSNIFARARLV